MMPTIRIDDDVFRALQRHAEPFVDSPNSVLRRVLGLDEPSPDDNTVPKLTSRREIAQQSVVNTELQFKTSPKVIRKRRNRGQRRASDGELLPLERYSLPILEAIRELGGESPTDTVIDLVGEKLKDDLTPADKEKYPSGMVRWRNRTQWQRKELVNEGLLDPTAPRGMWRLTEKGLRRVTQRI